MSAPAVKAFGPAPVITIARAFSSSSSSRRARMSSAFNIMDIALSLSGRFRVTRATESCGWTRIVSKFIATPVKAMGRLEASPVSLTLFKVAFVPGGRGLSTVRPRKLLALEFRRSLFEERLESFLGVRHREQSVLQLPFEGQALVHGHFDPFRHGPLDEADRAPGVLRIREPLCEGHRLFPELRPREDAVE